MSYVVCPWPFMNEGVTKPCSYAMVASPAPLPITDLPHPIVQDGKTTVVIFEDSYQTGLDRYGLFARILVDVDLSGDLPTEIVIKHNNGESFVQAVDYEKIPDLCSHCGNVGHCVTNCKFVKQRMVEVVLAGDVPGSVGNVRLLKSTFQSSGRARKYWWTPLLVLGLTMVKDPSLLKSLMSKCKRVLNVIRRLMWSWKKLSFKVLLMQIMRQDEAESSDLEICVSANEQLVVHESVPAKGVGSPTPLSSWYDETECEEVGGDFTLVQSKSQKKLMKRQAALASNREAYLRRSKDISK
ncbi:hypothetical protein ACLB2K_017467 [Fragaria x ananassa]